VLFALETVGPISSVVYVKFAVPDTDNSPALAAKATSEPANADTPTFFKVIHNNYSLFN